MSIRKNDLKPGDKVSIDQHTTRVKGRLLNSRGRGPSHLHYTGGTLFVDHASSRMFAHHQVSTRVGNTLMGKHAFEKEAGEHAVKLKSFHADNWPFAASEFAHDLELQGQTMTHSGAGAHHPNGVAERAIQTVMSWALCMMLHQLIHWPEMCDEALWPFALE